MQHQKNALKQWVETTLKQSPITLLPLTGDASFRRYYRLHTNNASYIVMDCASEKETLRSFLDIGHLLQEHDVLTPTVHAFDEQQGFALLDDFGDTLLLAKLQEHDTSHQDIDALYMKALTTLAHLQQAHSNTSYPLPVFDQSHMLRELSLLKTWYLEHYLKQQLTPGENKLIEATYRWLVEEISQQPYGFIHRDYHSRNIMLVNKDLGIIDFQDAMLGPISYDLVSLLKDCYIQWPTEQVTHWLNTFYDMSHAAQQLSKSAFKRAFDLCGLQRHLKVLGIFCRLCLRDNKPNYLADLPLTRHYVMACLESFPELSEFYDFMMQRGQLP